MALLGATRRKVAPTCALLRSSYPPMDFLYFFLSPLVLNVFSPFSDIPLQIGERQAQSQTSENWESNISGHGHLRRASGKDLSECREVPKRMVPGSIPKSAPGRKRKMRITRLFFSFPVRSLIELPQGLP